MASKLLDSIGSGGSKLLGGLLKASAPALQSMSQVGNVEMINKSGRNPDGSYQSAVAEGTWRAGDRLINKDRQFDYNEEYKKAQQAYEAEQKAFEKDLLKDPQLQAMLQSSGQKYTPGIYNYILGKQRVLVSNHAKRLRLLQQEHQAYLQDRNATRRGRSYGR